MIPTGHTANSARTVRRKVSPAGVGGVLLAGGGLFFLLGCRTTHEPVFEPIADAPAWPPAPAPARIRYVGQLRSAADLKPIRKSWDVFRDLLAGPEAPEELYGPRSVVCTQNGRRVWVCDPGGRCVHVFDLADRGYRKITRVGRSQLLAPTDICAGPPGTLFLCDTEDNTIYKISDRSGSLVETVQTGPDLLRAVAIDWSEGTGELYVADIGAHDIKVLDGRGRLLRTVGGRGVEPGRFNFPSDVLVDGDRLWVVDSGNQRVQGLSLGGDPRVVIGKPGDAPGDLALPKSIAVDGDGHLYVVDARFENVQVFDRAGRLLMFWGEEGHEPGAFWLPGGIYIDVNDRIWVCDSYNRRIQVFDYIKTPPAVEDSTNGAVRASHKPAQR